MRLQERVYRALLRAYPRSFRGEYADLMAQLFADQVRYARDGHGPGVVSIWLRGLIDVFSSATAHRLRKEFHVSLSYYPAMTILLGITLVLLMFGGPILAIPVFILEIIGFTILQRRTGFTRPTIDRPSRVILIGCAMIGLSTALLISPLFSRVEWGTLAFGVVWMIWAVISVAGLGFIAAGLMQVTSNLLTRRSGPRAA